MVAVAAALTAPPPTAAARHPPHDRSDVCLVPGVGKPLDKVWHPHWVAAIGYNVTRTGDIAFAVRTGHRFYGYRSNHTEWSASVVKAMLMVTYLDMPSVRKRSLSSYDRSLLGPMITQSDNTAAQQVFNTVGQGGLQGLANRVGMAHFATSPIWGETEITARDQTKFFLHIDSYVVRLHRAYAMRLLRSIIPSERWGIGEVAPKGWKLYFKGGWGYGTGLIDSQVALLVRGCARVSIAVLTMYDGSHEYGKATLRGMFSRLLRGLPTGRKHHRHRHHRRPHSR
ncbi:MAG: class A beta-lactamase-related serine hydrolase [Actinomycetota bacterium]|nr:class A beta-lactamase-related serine hydrolase [Actinomycetota bacterium]